MTKPPKDTIQLIAPELNPAQVANIYRYIRDEVIGGLESEHPSLDGAFWEKDAGYWERHGVNKRINTQLQRLDKYFRRDG